MQSDAELRLHIVGEKTASIVHDLKNPVSTIKALAEMANDDSIGKDDRSEYLKMIVHEVENIMDMIGDIMDFSKGEIQNHPELLDWREFVDEISIFLKSQLVHHNITLKVHIDVQTSIRIDPYLIRRVILNIIHNAMEAFPINHENKYIEFHSSLNENWLNIRIQDNGIGMPPQIYEHLFEIFQTHGKSKGTGLGLYNCKKIITAMNGTIECLTKQNDGTSFTIQIPIIANT